MKEHYYEKIPFWCFSAEDEHILKDILRELKRVFDVTLTTTYASSLYASLGMTVDYKNAFILYRPSESNGENKCIGALIKVGNKYKVGAMPGDEFLDALEQKDTAEEEVPPKKKKPSKAPDTTPEEDKEEEVEEHKEAEEIKKKRHRRTKAELAAALEATAKEQEDSKKTVEEPKKRKKPAPFKSTPEDIDTQTKAIENKMKGIKEVKEPIADESSKRTRKVKTEAPAKEPVRSDVKGSKSGKTRK
jgi:hypothetical protein